jgi:hypothetical protein
MTDEEIDALYRALRALGLTQVTPGTWGLRMPDGSLDPRNVMDRDDLRGLTPEAGQEHLESIKAWIADRRQR